MDPVDAFVRHLGDHIVNIVYNEGIVAGSTFQGIGALSTIEDVCSAVSGN